MISNGGSGEEREFICDSHICQEATFIELFDVHTILIFNTNLHLVLSSKLGIVETVQ